jgi:hypothetical protein
LSTQTLGLDLSRQEALVLYRILVERPYLDDPDEASLFKKTESALHGLLSLEEMQAQGRGGRA